MRLGELFVEAGGPPGILNVVNGDKEAVDAILDDPDIQAIGFVGSTPIADYIYSRGCAARQARAVLRRRQEPYGGHARRRHGPDGRRADRRRLRLGRRALHGDLGRGAGRPEDRRRARPPPHPPRRSAQDRPVDRRRRRFRPARHQGRAREGASGYVDLGVKEGAKLVVDGRGFKMQGYENGFYMGGCLFDHVTKDMRIYKEEIFGPVLSVVRAHDYAEALGLCNDHEYGNGVAIFTRDGDAARDFASKVKVGMIGVNVPIPVPVAYYTFGGWKRSGFGDLNQHGPEFDPLLHPHQDGDRPLALGHQGRRAVLDPDDGLRLRAGAEPSSLAFFTARRCARIMRCFSGLYVGKSAMATALKHLTTDEFLLWAEGREGRWELFDGVPVMMSPERVIHGDTKGEAYAALREALRRAGLPCRVYPDGVAVKIERQTTYQPDASVSCGPRPPADALTIADPVVVVEVLSPSTAAIDHGRKLSGYFSLPSVEHYLILDPERRVVIHHKRGPGRRDRDARPSEGSAKLDPPGFEVAVEALFPPASD